MRYSEFKNAGVRVSSLAVGTWAIGGAGWGKVNDDDSIQAVRTMIDNGVNFIDTAPLYGFGHAEQVLAKALSEGYRDKTFLATKFGVALDPSGKGLARNSKYDSILKECDASLARLETDHIDFYIQHWPDAETPVAETMSALNDLKKAGKIRFIGFANVDAAFLEEAVKYGQVDVVQPPFSMVNQSQRDLLVWCEQRGVASTTYGSLGGGILTGTIRELPEFAPNDNRLTFYDFFREPKFSKIMELLKVLDTVAANHNAPVAQVAINWSTQKSFVGTAMCGVRNAAEAAENCRAFEWKLEDAEMELIDSQMRRLGL